MLSEKQLTTEKNSQNNDKVVIYVRNCAKKAIMLTLPRLVRVSSIKQKIFTKMKIQPANQLLFLQGELIQSPEQQIQLKDRIIFHLVNARKVNQSEINIDFRRIQENTQLFSFKINSSTKIQDFILSHLHIHYQNMKDYFLVYTGRQLRKTKTFRQEHVEDGSEILCIHRVKDLKKTLLHSFKNKVEDAENDTQDILITNQQKYSRIPSKMPKNQQKRISRDIEEKIQLSEEEQTSSKNYLPFSVISSRHEEEESFQQDLKKKLTMTKSDHKPYRRGQEIQEEEQDYQQYSLKRNPKIKVEPSSIFNPHIDFS